MRSLSLLLTLLTAILAIQQQSSKIESLSQSTSDLTTSFSLLVASASPHANKYAWRQRGFTARRSVEERREKADRYHHMHHNDDQHNKQKSSSLSTTTNNHISNYDSFNNESPKSKTLWQRCLKQTQSLGISLGLCRKFDSLNSPKTTSQQFTSIMPDQHHSDLSSSSMSSATTTTTSPSSFTNAVHMTSPKVPITWSSAYTNSLQDDDDDDDDDDDANAIDDDDELPSLNTITETISSEPKQHLTMTLKSIKPTTIASSSSKDTIHQDKQQKQRLKQALDSHAARWPMDELTLGRLPHDKTSHQLHDDDIATTSSHAQPSSNVLDTSHTMPHGIRGYTGSAKQRATIARQQEAHGLPLHERTVGSKLRQCADHRFHSDIWSPQTKQQHDDNCKRYAEIDALEPEALAERDEKQKQQQKQQQQRQSSIDSFDSLLPTALSPEEHAWRASHSANEIHLLPKFSTNKSNDLNRSQSIKSATTVASSAKPSKQQQQSWLSRLRRLSSNNQSTSLARESSASTSSTQKIKAPSHTIFDADLLQMQYAH
jgi:hypothetical protein